MHHATAPFSAASPSATVYTASAHRARPPTISLLLWCGFLLVFGFLVQGITALVPPPTLSSHLVVPGSTLHERQVVGDAVAMANKLIAHYNARVSGSDLGETLV
jgi:hypothetical protein